MTTKQQFQAMQKSIATEAKAIMPYGYTVETPFSETDYGMSAYVVVYNQEFQQVAKFRVSDHPVENIDRLRNEVHYLGASDLATFDPFRAVEMAIYPERYAEVKEVLYSEVVESALPVGTTSSFVPANAVVVGQKVSKKSGNICDIYQWTKTTYSTRWVRIA